MKKYFSFFFFALLAMLVVGCDSPSAYNPSGGDSDDDGGSSSKSYVTTGEAKDVTYRSATLYGEVNVEISDYDEIEWGVMYSTDKAELESYLGIKVLAEGALEEDVYSVSVTGLESETKYYYSAFVFLNEKQYKYGSVKSFTTYEAPTGNGTLNGHEWVDLGLPSGLKWATCNVGASQPEEYGDYFAWGEVEPKDYYDWSTYKWCNGSYDTQTKYCNDSYYGYNGFTDNKTTLELSDDAANYNWGGAWRMPTKEEQDELRNNCSWEWTTQNGVYGRKVTGPNGNSTFLPAAGGHYDSSLRGAGSYGRYWSSSLDTYGPLLAYYLDFGSDYVDWSNGYRYYGYSVRPVCP